jgi:hypothetical protein
MVWLACGTTQVLLMTGAGIKHPHEPSINKKNTYETNHGRLEDLGTHSLSLYQKIPFSIETPSNRTKNDQLHKDHA